LIVIDASAVLELLLRTERGEQVEARALAAKETLAAPHLLDLEVAQGLRRLVASKGMTAPRAEQSLQDYANLRIERVGHLDLLPRIWQLRNSLSAYDAAYVALTEALGASLLTCDMKLARSHGHRARIEVVE
jgi:predicted nucleic acid-binding protein